MSLELTEKDFVPLAECQFQHWGERCGPPYSHIRPLSATAAERVWRRTAALAVTAWDEAASADSATALDPGVAGDGDRLDLASCGDWDEASVRHWLLSRVLERNQTVFACYQPGVVVAVPWGVVCDHWLIFFWTGGCVWPASEQWVLVHDGEQFAFGRKR